MKSEIVDKAGATVPKWKNKLILPPWLIRKVFLIKQSAHKSVVFSTAPRSARLGTEERRPAVSLGHRRMGRMGASVPQNSRLSSSSEAGAREGSSWDNYQHSSSLVVSFSSSGELFSLQNDCPFNGCHLLIKVIWEFSQQTNHKIGPCIMFRILSFNKTFYKLGAYLLTSSSSPSRGPAAHPVVHNALTALGEL